MQFLDFSSLIFLAIAIFFFLKLRSVLGKRTGHERRQLDRYADKPGNKRASSSDNVITLPKGNNAHNKSKPERQEKDAPPKGTISAEAMAAQKILAPILVEGSSLDVEEFLMGARKAYEMIVSAYAAGERQTLKPLLSDEVYTGFEKAIAERESRKETVDFTFIGIEKAKIIHANKAKNEIRITVKYVSELISATRAQDGGIVDGNPTKVITVTDIWTFARNPRSRDPNWKLIATEAED